MGFIKRHKVLLCIIIIAAFLRLYKLNTLPPGIHGDEASIGYTAYSLLKTGKDQNGNFLPISIDQFGDERPAGYHYLDVPFVGVFGLNGFSVRLPAALFGIANVILLYFLVLEFFDSEQLALLSSLLLAITPWDVNISRASSESIIAGFFVMLGVYFLYRELKREARNYKLLFFSFVCFFLSVFFYHAPFVFLPLFIPLLLGITYLQKKYTTRKVSIVAGFFALVVLSLVLLSALQGNGRANQIGLFSIPGGTIQLKQAMDEEGTLNPLLTRFYDNKLFFYGRFFATFYSEHLNGDFLFVNTGSPVRYKIPFTGNFYMIEAPFFLLGLAFLLSEGIKKRRWEYLIPVAWLLISPIPAAVTWEDLPNVIRASLMIPAVTMISAFGFIEIFNLVSKRWRSIFIWVFAVLLLQGFLYFYHNYFWRLPVHEPWNRSAAEEDLLSKVYTYSQGKQTVIMTGEHNNNFIFYLFYNKFDPAKFQAMGSPKDHDGLHFQNLVYTGNPCPLRGDPNHDELSKSMESNLYVDKEDCPLPRNAQVLDTSRTPDGLPAFLIIKLNPPAKP